MKKVIITGLAVAALLLGACTSEPGFIIKGEITGGEGKMLYLSHIGVDKSAVVDSVRLTAKGDFSFGRPAPECYDFYRLHTLSGAVNLSVDSTETLTVHGSYANLSRGYTVEGSPSNERIKELTLMQMDLQQWADSVWRSAGPAVGIARRLLNERIDSCRELVKRVYIYPEPYAASAYFALFMQAGGRLLFSPADNYDDARCFAAVATHLNDRHPHAARSMHLYNLALRCLRDTRPARTDTAAVRRLSELVQETSIIDIALNDMQGNERRLTQLRGDVVLLHFTLYQDTQLALQNIALRELYDRYHSRGFQIYQVSIDPNEQQWKTSADNLPWICVRDAGGLESVNMRLYGVSKLPSYFLIDRSNSVVARDENIKDLAAEIEKLLAQEK